MNVYLDRAILSALFPIPPFKFLLVLKHDVLGFLIKSMPVLLLSSLSSARKRICKATSSPGTLSYNERRKRFAVQPPGTASVTVSVKRSSFFQFRSLTILLSPCPHLPYSRDPLFDVSFTPHHPAYACVIRWVACVSSKLEGYLHFFVIDSKGKRKAEAEPDTNQEQRHSTS